MHSERLNHHFQADSHLPPSLDSANAALAPVPDAPMRCESPFLAIPFLAIPFLAIA